VSFAINAADPASFNTNSTSWIANAGKYTVKIGASSLNIKQSASFQLAKDVVAEKVHKVLVRQMQINELKK